MTDEPKTCRHCGKTFVRPLEMGRRQWANKWHCDRACLRARRSTPDLLPEEIDRFWSKIGPPEADGCRYWTGERDGHGYGLFRLWRNGAKTTLKAHRLVFVLSGNVLPPGKHVLHSCDRPTCVNLDHLRPGTHQENMAEAFERGRMLDPPRHVGERHPQSRLTEAQVVEIRQRFAEGGVTYTQLGHEFGVSRHTIRKIVDRLLWRHVTDRKAPTSRRPA